MIFFNLLLEILVVLMSLIRECERGILLQVIEYIYITLVSIQQVLHLKKNLQSISTETDVFFSDV